MKIDKVSREEATEMVKNRPVRQVGQWKDIMAEVKKTGQAVTISDVTDGQLWSIKRQAKDQGLLAVMFRKEGKILISMPPKK